MTEIDTGTTQLTASVEDGVARDVRRQRSGAERPRGSPTAHPTDFGRARRADRVNAAHGSSKERCVDNVVTLKVSKRGQMCPCQSPTFGASASGAGDRHAARRHRCLEPSADHPLDERTGDDAPAQSPLEALSAAVHLGADVVVADENGGPLLRAAVTSSGLDYTTA